MPKGAVFCNGMPGATVSCRSEAELSRQKDGPADQAPWALILRRIISLSVVIVRACGRSSKHGTSHLARRYPQSAVQGLLGASLEAGHDDGEICGEAEVSAYVVKPAGGLGRGPIPGTFG